MTCLKKRSCCLLLWFAMLLPPRACLSQPTQNPLPLSESASAKRRLTAADYVQLVNEIVQIVRDNFYDEKRAELWAEAHKRYAEGVENQADFAQKINAALNDLHASHTAYYTPLDAGYYALTAIFQQPLQLKEVWKDSIGADFAPIEGHFYVRRIFTGSPAEKVGLKRGDEIVRADGKPFAPIASFQGRAESVVTLAVKRKAGEPEREIRVVPRRVHPKEEWLQAQKNGSRLIKRNGKRIGYLPLFVGAGEEYQQAAREAIQTTFSTADALIFDIRDGYGGCNPDFVNLFNPAVPLLTYTDRTGSHAYLDSIWRKPLYVLINGGSRSGKEVVAFGLKRERRGLLIGERTAGAVVAGRPFLLSDRSLLYLAVVDVRVDGQRLEGAGVEPDIVVKETLPYAAGADLQLERALMLATESRQKGER